ncbi:MAG: hypothetical protein SCH68_00300 [Brevefilum sp.]|nr:hypothetical protein [Brevefilum sp.]
MKKSKIEFPELIKVFAFLLYLLGSSLTLINHGIEISLWIMTFAVVINIALRILSWMGFCWLSLSKMGSKTGSWLAVLLDIASWGSFGYAMYLRLWRNLPMFYTMITITTLLWAVGLLLFLYSRHAFTDGKTGDKLDKN